MSKSLLRTDKEIAEIYQRHYKTVYRLCFSYMKNKSDTEDAVQETFLKMIRKGPAFESTEHEKAWLIRTASNTCKDALKSFWRKHEDIEEHCDVQSPISVALDYVMDVVMGLPDKYKDVVYMYYYEGYNSNEIAEMLKKLKSTIRNYLHEARAILKERLGDDFSEE